MTTEEKNKLLKEFLDKFSKLENLTLENYTGLKEGNNERDDFTYWVERKLDTFGGIKGGSSAKFGIYKYNPNKQPTNAGTGNCYAWSGNFETAVAAFDNVKSKLCAIKAAAENTDGVLYDKIEGVNLAPTYKWKVAFLYSKGRLVPVYKIEALAQAAKRLEISVDSKDTIGALQKKLMEYYKDKDCSQVHCTDFKLVIKFRSLIKFSFTLFFEEKIFFISYCLAP